MKTDLPHLDLSPGLAAPHPHTPKGGGGAAEAVPNLPSLCRTSSAAGAAGELKGMPPAVFRKLKRELREERGRRERAEAERDAVQMAFEKVLDGLQKRGQGGE